MLGKIGDTNMKDWENDYAAAFFYQDLADCSLEPVPVVVEIQEAKNTSTTNDIQKKKQEVTANNFLQKASAYLFVLMSVITHVI